MPVGGCIVVGKAKKFFERRKYQLADDIHRNGDAAIL
jgi:hypothetical protein